MTDALSYQDTGGGPAVLFLHGNLSRGSHWAPQPEALGYELRCIAPDQRGFGRSTGGPLPTSLLGLADDAVRLCAELGVDRAHVVGPLVPSGRPTGRGPSTCSSVGASGPTSRHSRDWTPPGTTSSAGSTSSRSGH